MNFPGVVVVKNPLANVGDARDTCSIPGSGRSPGGANGNPLQFSCLEHPMDRGAWQATVHGVAKSQTQLSEHAGRYKWVKVKFLKKRLNNLSAMNLIFKRQKLWDIVLCFLQSIVLQINASRKINTIMFLKDKNLKSLFFYKHVWYE